MSKLDLEWLAVFEEIYQTRSVSRAADKLGMAQATASIALNKLRTHFGDKLFSRTASGMQPTAYAAQIRPALNEVLQILAGAHSARVAFDPATSRRTFRICMTDIRQRTMLPGIVNHLRSLAPGLRIEADMISEDSPRLLQDGQQELAIGYMPQLEAGFFQRTLLDEDFVVLASARHSRLAGKLTLKAFLAEGHIVVGMSGTGASIVDKTLATLGHERDVALKVPGFLGVAEIVAATELLVVVPRSLGEAMAGQEHVRLLASPVKFPSYSVRLYWHEQFHVDAGNVWLRQVIFDLFHKDRRQARPAETKLSTR